MCIPLGSTLQVVFTRLFLSLHLMTFSTVLENLAFLVWLLAFYSIFQGHHLLHLGLKFKSNMFCSCFLCLWYSSHYNDVWIPKFSQALRPFLLIPASSDILQPFLHCVFCPSPSFHSSWPLVFATFFQRKLLMLFCWFFKYYSYMSAYLHYFFFWMPVQHVQALVPLVSWLFASTTHKNLTLVSTGAFVFWEYLANRK